MITGLRTNNFKKLESFTATFQDGTNLIFGENGEGKSTSFDAFRFALFGAKGVTGTVDSLTTWNKTGMWVELDISGFTIRRTASNCKITDQDGEVVASGNSPCVKFIEELLACSVKDFDLLYMSKQGETAGLITFGATELNRKVEEYAGVALIDKVIKSLGSEVHGCQVALESFEFIPVEELETELSNIESEGQEQAQLIESSTAEYTNLDQQVDQIRARLQEDREFNQEQENITKRNESLSKRINSAETLVAASKKALESAEDDLSECEPADETAIEALEEDIDKVKSTTTKLSRLKNEADIIVSIEEAESKVGNETRYQAELPSLEEAVTKAQSSLDEKKSLHSELLSEYRKACQSVDSGVCGECNRPLEDHDPEVAEEAKKEASSKVAAQKVLVEVAESNLNAAKTTLREHHNTNPGTGWSAKLETLQSELEVVREERIRLEGVLAKLELEDTLQTKLNSLVSDQKVYKRCLRVKQVCEQDYKDNVQELEDLKATKTEEAQEKRDVFAIETEANTLINLRTKVGNELSEQRTRKAVLGERYKSINNQIASAKANNTKMSELEKELDISKQLRKYLNDERVKFMEGVWRTILGTASNFINKSTEGWITKVGRNEKGDFTFTENGYEAIAKESASGAQKAFIGTAIKVGLAQAKMGNSSMVFLDEPTADMRNDRASQLAAGLMMLSGQKIMITHRDSERMIAQNIIHVGE